MGELESNRWKRRLGGCMQVTFDGGRRFFSADFESRVRGDLFVRISVPFPVKQRVN